MWPKNFNFFGIIDDIKKIFIFNTIKSLPEGLTYYDLTQLGNIPHSKIYRMMKKLEEEGELIKQERTELGRPKHVYFVSEKGEKTLQQLRDKLKTNFDLIKTRDPDFQIAFNHEKILTEGTFKIWCSPVEYIIQLDASDTEKYSALNDMEEDLNHLLKKIQNEKHKLEKQLDPSSYRTNQPNEDHKESLNDF
jgi:DNA-binding PadR family transcriptional regulator